MPYKYLLLLALGSALPESLRLNIWSLLAGAAVMGVDLTMQRAQVVVVLAVLEPAQV